RAEPASLTKLMTAYVVFKALQEGRLKLTDEVTISEHAWRAEGSRTFVQVGTQIPVDILIKGMIVQSGNDATIALAERVGGTEAAFAQMMNEYARRLGMKGSNFENSDGLPAPNHYTTARDMATLADALIREFPQYYPLFSLREFQWNNIRQGNRNTLLGRTPRSTGSRPGTPTAPATAWRPPRCAAACAWCRWSWVRRARRRARMPRRPSSATATPSSRRCASRPRTTRCSSRAC